MIWVMLFWASSMVLAYGFFGYGVLVVILARVLDKFRPPRNICEVASDLTLPTISVLVCARNEEVVIARRIANVLEQDYPSDRVEAILVSDGSTDRTAEIARSFVQSNVRVLEHDESRGKNHRLNEAIGLASGSVIVFSDANSEFEPTTLMELVRALLADRRIGCVSGLEIHSETERDEGAVATVEATYYDSESSIKLAENRLGVFFSANGSVLAVWKRLLRPLEDVFPNDFQIPLDVIAQGYLASFSPMAIAKEKSASHLHEEYQRKKRIVSRAVSCFVGRMSSLPMRTILAIMSHKLIRWVALPVLILLLVANGMLVLAASGWFYTGALVVQAAFWGCVFLGMLCSRFGSIPRLLAYPTYLAITVVSAFHGVLLALAGRGIVRWNAAPSTRRN